MVMKTIELTGKEEKTLQMHNPKNIGRLLNMWKRYFDNWANEQLFEHGYSYFKMAYMPFIMNISNTGSTNNEIALKAKVTKQAMSKVVKELLQHGIIKIEKHADDKRASLIFLTPKGKKLVVDTKSCVIVLSEEYKEIVGTENFDIMIECMYKILQHHEAKNEGKLLQVF